MTIEEKNKQLREELQYALDMLCDMCVRLNPHHKQGREDGSCTCIGTNDIRKALKKQ